MKTAIIIFLTSISIQSTAQTPITYTEVVPLAGVSKTELYTRARQWFSEAYKSADNVIQMDDKQAGIIIGKALFRFKSGVAFSAIVEGVINYTVKISVKEGRYKYEITNFIHEARNTAAAATDFGLITDSPTSPVTASMSGKKFSNKVWADMQYQSKAYGKQIEEDILKSMQHKSETNDNW